MTLLELLDEIFSTLGPGHAWRRYTIYIHTGEKKYPIRSVLFGVDTIVLSAIETDHLEGD